MSRSLTPLLVLLSALPLAGAGEVRDVPHPFLLWTKEEAAAIRQRIETDPLAKQQLERMARIDGGAKGGPPLPKGASNPTLFNLFKYLVLGDQAAGAAEKKNLLGFIGKVPEPMTQEFKDKIAEKIREVGGDEDKIWTRGNASFADRHHRDEQTLNTLRYDVLYDQLSAEERAGVETALRTYIRFHLDGHKPWHPDFRYGRQSWLPNMSWPRAIGTHLMAVALKDAALIDAMHRSLGGWKWFFDAYVCDRRFYCEEFGKYYSNIGTMLLYCEGLERLGLGAYGWGHTGADGASMLEFLKMPLAIAYPRTDIPGGMANWRRVTMGDAKDANGVFEQSFIRGFLPDGSGGDPWWTSANMNGPLPKAAQPLWLEIGHRRFPDQGFDYFLAQLRAPGQAVYLPSLYFGLGPIDPAAAKPPAPLPSYLAQQRGFAFLRADATPAYWEGPAPAVALQFGMYYAHYAHDCFSILGYQALNRPIYLNAGGAKATDHYVLAQIKDGPPTGYIARHPWKDTNRGHCGVVVDHLGARPVDDGEHGLKRHRTRELFTPAVQFVAGRAKGVYPEVDQERALLLTREYLLDVTWLSAPGRRRYDWHVHGPGSPQPGADWKPTSELNGSMLYREPDQAQPEGYAEKTDANDLVQVRAVSTDKDWSSVILQDCRLADAGKAKLGAAWYARGVGVRVSVLGEPGTRAFTGLYPDHSAEWGGSTLMIRREAPGTVFAALHEPFEGGLAKAPATAFTRLAASPRGVAVRIAGAGFDDRAVIAYGDGSDQPLTLEGGKERFTVTGQGWLRIHADRVEAVGGFSALAVAVRGTPTLVLNGTAAPAAVVDGVLTFPAP